MIDFTVSSTSVTTPPVSLLPYTTVVDLYPTWEDGCCLHHGKDPLAQYQSSHIYLQATGSDGADGSVEGYHLRWDLRKHLGETHLPKGNLAAPGATYATALGFSRADDFVRIHKAPYTTTFPVTADLLVPPSIVDELGAIREWRYTGLTPVPGDPSVTTDLFARFIDIAQYDLLRVTIDPNVNALDFIKAYTGILELGAVGKPAFKMHVTTTIAGAVPVDVKGECISQHDNTDPTTRYVSSAQNLVMGSASFPAFEEENIEMVRMTYQVAYPSTLTVETYQDFIAGADSLCGWTKVGKYSLDDGVADTNAAVFKQLNDGTAWTIHDQWPKYNETSPSGEFKVKVDNYQDRWTDSPDGLQTAVADYLDLSRTDVEAVKVLPSPEVTDLSTLEVSYLDLLNLVSLDYHAARMLGLGFIDGNTTEAPAAKWVYLMEYVTEAPLKTGDPPSFVRHYHMSMPVSKMDSKLPPTPDVETLPVYGIETDVLSGTPASLVGPDGYAPYDNIRFINLHRRPFLHESPFGPFWSLGGGFTLSANTIPVMYGVEYRDDAAGPGNYVRPEILQDPVYSDPAGLPEVTTALETGSNPVFTHLERNEGIHHYALYSINWFSRASGPSAEISTDYTLFPKPNLLLPPASFAVQLIQKETPLIFTTSLEQSRLDAIPIGSDKTLVRATFDWNHIHNTNYQVADKIELFFRKTPPATVKGKVAAVTPVPGGTHTVEVSTTDYLIASTTPPSSMTPFVAMGDEPRYIGGMMVCNGKPFVIQNIYTAGPNPVFVLEQIRSTQSVDPDNDGIWSIIETYENPSVDDLFFVIENLNSAPSWSSQLVKEITLKNFAPLHTETMTYTDGSTHTFNIGGLTATATISHIPDPPTLTSPSGVYLIEFDTAVLTPYATEFGDLDVEYYQGVVRVPLTGGEHKALQVIHIDVSGTTLKLRAFDPDHLTDPIIPNVLGTYPGILVNFHPSYRAYFYADTAGGNIFEEASILPSWGEGTRETFMAARSKDSTNGYVSSMTPPATLLALELQEPVPPGVPTGPTFATRPNFYGKATYTFDVEVDQPFSLIFYRANERRILEQLYKPETVRLIIDDLAALTSPDRDFFTDRWSDLANCLTDGAGLFKEYVPGGYRFPIPDSLTYEIPGTAATPFAAGSTPPGSSSIVPGTGSPGLTMAEVVKDAIDGAFLPLTEQPAVYSQLQDKIFQTSGRPPRLRNANGDRLLPEDIDYDPWPMCFRYEKDISGNIYQRADAGYGDPAHTRLVRFTDFTLDGSSIHVYFYFAVELSNRLTVSDRSPISGPIQLVNSYPAEAPQVKKIITNLSNALTSSSTSVSFEVEPYIDSERIKEIHIYRTTSPTDELSVRTMTLARAVAVGDPLVDDFSDLTFPPYGDPLFYRLVAVREIVNEQGLPELIPSKPSNAALTSVVDNVNPPAPVIGWTSDPPTPSPVLLNNVVLSWNPTCYNGTYYLFKQTSAGQWQKIAQADGNSPMSVALATTTWGSGTLEKEDADGNTLYHRFKVTVENASGLLNLVEREVTV